MRSNPYQRKNAFKEQNKNIFLLLLLEYQNSQHSGTFNVLCQSGKSAWVETRFTQDEIFHVRGSEKK